MFQTEPILWLQSLHSDGLTFFMRAVSMIVDDTVFLLLGLIVFFMIDHRKGFAALLILLWVALFTAALKDSFALPRPSDVDMRVRLLETGQPNDSPLLAHGADTFFGLPSPEALMIVRNRRAADFGLPSGHCSSTVAFWGMLALLFRKRWVSMSALGLALLMPVSRMYLGRHFLGDTLAGLLLGALVLVVAAAVMRYLGNHPEGVRLHRARVAPSLMKALLLLVLPVLPVLFTPTRTFASTLLALGMVYFTTGGLNVYSRASSLPTRLLLTLLAVVIVAGLQHLLKGVLPKSISYGLVIISVFGSTAILIGMLASRSDLKQNL